MKLAFGQTFESLHLRDGILALDAHFVQHLREAEIALHNRFLAARAMPESLAEKDHSQLLIDLAPHVEDFLARLFAVHAPLSALQALHHEQAPLFACKRLLVQRRAAKAFKPEIAAALHVDDVTAPLDALLGPGWDELAFATATLAWLDDEANHKIALDAALAYAAWALHAPEGQARHARGVVFKLPHKLEPEHLIPVETELRHGVQVQKLPDSRRHARDGFALTDARGTLTQALDHAHYCIYCHNQGRDSCSKGFREKDGTFRKNSLDITLSGCPLEEKISEMNYLKSQGSVLGALAVVCVDNPLCAGTGHRICNDCMKSCIYQKQEPVNIPLVETRVLDDVLSLPFGFEIYSLLTRWNPLNLMRPVPREETGARVLVAGLGPAGYTLSHHLLNDGHTVFAIDGLKIEPLPQELLTTPVQDVKSLHESLDSRVMGGFGGVEEYGITVRWDKNFLKLIRLLLERRSHFALAGGVRFGGQLTHARAFELGFDHIALCLGAGRPTLLEIENGLSRGVRAASDFLMSLQLSGAARKDSIANLQLRLPAVVIGGGLTAIDTATEALAYYPVQVEKFLDRYEALVAARGEAHTRRRWNKEDAEIAEDFLSHGRAIRNERARAAQEGRAPDFFPLLDAWGGVKILYRKRLIDAPSYRLNHEEVEKAFEEGMFFAEHYEPERVEVDAYGHACALRLKSPSGPLTLPARAILVAAGTSPNTVLAREDATHFTLDDRYFQAVDESGLPVRPERNPKPKSPHVLFSVEPDGRAVSFFGDLHPSFAGNVVRAMASAKQGYPVISRALAGRGGQREIAESDQFLRDMRARLGATVHAVNRLTPTIVEVVIHAPLAAEAFQPGQFYRLQNFETHAPKLTVDNCPLTTTLAMEGLAMTGAWVDKKSGLLSVIALEMGGSSDLCAHLKPGEPVVLMGPTGAPTEITKNETVLLAGGGLGNAVLFSIGQAMRASGCRVLYFAGYRTQADRYKTAEIENAADIVVWCCDEATLERTREQDFTFHGNIVQAMQAYAEGRLGEAPIPLSAVQRIIAIGSDRMMQAVGAARHGVLKPYLAPSHCAIGSINSPMQCMMKEICAQCVQQHVNPQTGKTSYVYSCFNQDQKLDEVYFSHLSQRLAQNSLQEKITAEWIDFVLKNARLRSRA